MKAGIVAASAAIVGSVAATAHKAHNGFHARRGGYAEAEVCETVNTVYTTIYVTAGDVPSAAPNATVYATPSSTPEAPSVYVPVPLPSTSEKPVAPSSEYVPAPAPSTSEKPKPVASSKAEYTPKPAPSSKAEYVPKPAPSSKAEYVPKPTPSSKAEYVPKPAPSSKAEYVPMPAPSSKTEVAKPKPSKSAGGHGAYGANITPNGQKWAITYTPYAESGDCKSAGEVQSDIAKIADLGYTTIRSYSTDCGVFENVVPACEKHGLKVIYGIFLDAAKAPNSDGANEQLQDIIDNAPKDSIAMLIVGNEYIFGHGGTAGELAPYIKTVKEKLVGAGFPSTVPVTTTEPVGTWEQYGSALCDVIDVFAVQVHPFFDGGISAGEAGDFAAKQLEQAAKVCPEAASKGKYITEIGWPTGGQANGVAIPGSQEQKKALASIIESVGDKACLFSFQNDRWKEPGSFGVEQKFGCSDAL